MSNLPICSWALRLGSTAIALLLASFVAIGPALAQSDFFVIQNRWSPDDLLNVEADVAQASPVSARDPEAQWLFEPAEESPFFRLLNVGTGLYLQNASGQLVVGPLGPGADPDWSLEALPDVPDPRIQSRAGGYLHTHDGPLVVGDASPNWGDSYWRILPASVAIQPSPGIVSGPGPVVIRPPRGSGYFIPVPIPIPFPIGVLPPPWPVCPPGHHLSKGHCCPPLSSWSFMQQACVLQIKPIACPPGQHLSQGHCCPALRFWSKAKQQCVFQVFQPIACPKGQHLSNGHCCPNLQFWSPAKKQCVFQIVQPIVCPQGQHLSQGHCCPNLQTWDAKQNKCVLQIVQPIVCPKGQHLSDGHCCPALQSWDDKQNKCVLAIKGPVKGPIVKEVIKVPLVCPAGQHLSDGHCCPNQQSWDAKQNKCVLPVKGPIIIKDPIVKDPIIKDPVKAPIIKDAVKAPILKDPVKPIVKETVKTPIVKETIKTPVVKALCPAGQHMSQGHCCPAGKNWNEPQKKCA